MEYGDLLVMQGMPMDHVLAVHTTLVILRLRAGASVLYRPAESSRVCQLCYFGALW